jgi:hypothetical protein
MPCLKGFTEADCARKPGIEGNRAAVTLIQRLWPESRITGERSVSNSSFRPVAEWEKRTPWLHGVHSFGSRAFP